MKKLSVALICCLMPIGLLAQQPPANKQPTAEELGKTMEATMAPMASMMTRMTEMTMEAMLKKSEEPATAMRIARFKKNLYDALMKEGFSKEQAMSIVVNTGIPSATGLTK